MGPSAELIAPSLPQVLGDPSPQVALRALLTHGASWPQERTVAEPSAEAAHSSSFISLCF